MNQRLVFTVTNDLIFDQRMNRICTSLSNAGYSVLLVGKKSPKVLPEKSFLQQRLSCFFQKGKLFYLEYNIRLFIFLLFTKFDLVCAIDLDTIAPCYYASSIKRKRRVYDAHELFCEMKEVISRPKIYRVWKNIEKKFVPRFQYGYTVNTYIKDILNRDYKVAYDVIRNIPVLQKEVAQPKTQDFIIYQGAVNYGRSFETLIPAFQWIEIPLFIYGEGNYFEKAGKLIQQYKLEERVFLKGPSEPQELRQITPKAKFGITIFENQGLSNYYSLANRFFDYMHAGIPQICVDYPAYREINDRFKVAVLIRNLSPESLAKSINELADNTDLQAELIKNCLLARQELNWQKEEKKLISFYEAIFSETGFLTLSIR